MRVPGRRFALVLWNLLNAASIMAWLVSLGVGGIVTTIAGWLASFDSSWQWPFWVSLFVLITGITLTVLGRRFPALVSTQSGGGAGTASQRDWIPPEDLRAYLKSIKQTMEEEGFGSSPPPTAVESAASMTSSAPPGPEQLSNRAEPVRTLEQERERLLIRCHSLLAEMSALGGLGAARAVANAVTGYPAALGFVRDGQEFISRAAAGRAESSLIARYQNVPEARQAIEATLAVLSEIGDEAKP